MKTHWYALGNRCFLQNDLIKQICPNGSGQKVQTNTNNNKHKGGGGKGSTLSSREQYPREDVKDGGGRMPWPTAEEFVAYVRQLQKIYSFRSDTLDKAIAKWQTLDRQRDRADGIRDWRGWFLALMMNLENRGVGEMVTDPEFAG